MRTWNSSHRGRRGWGHGGADPALERLGGLPPCYDSHLTAQTHPPFLLISVPKIMTTTAMNTGEHDYGAFSHARYCSKSFTPSTHPIFTSW